MNRQDCLDEAMVIVHQDRNSEYGEPEDNFGDIGAYWTTFLRKKLKENEQITTPDVAIMSALIKVSRIQNTPTHEDSWVDIAGYAACGVQCATEAAPAITDIVRDTINKTRHINIPLSTRPPVIGSSPVLMICGCPLIRDNLVESVNGLRCSSCGYHYPWPEKKEN